MKGGDNMTKASMIMEIIRLEEKKLNITVTESYFTRRYRDLKQYKKSFLQERIDHLLKMGE